MLSPNQFSKVLGNLANEIDVIIDDAMVLGMNQAKGLILDRVFNDNLDAKGFSLGAYSPQYAKVRKEAGLQTSVVDLQFRGNLLKDIVDNTSSTGYRVLINSDLSVKKARGNEKRKGKKIFELSKDEEEACIKVINDFFVEKIVNGV